MGIPLALLAGVATAGINANSQRRREKTSMANQFALMKEQFNNQQMLNQQGADLQYQQWEKTNYPAQMEMLKKAGLNPGLLYGMSGGGGATAGSQGGGSAQGGQAPAPQQLGIENQIGKAIELGLMNAQKENIEADTENKKQQAEYTGGAQTESTKQQTETERHKTTEQKAAARYAEAKKMWEASKMEWESRGQQTKATTEQDTQKEKIEQEKIRTAGMIIDNIAKEEGVNLSRKQQYQIEEQIQQNWEKISLYDTEVNIKIAEAIIKGIGTVGGLVNARQIAEMLAKAKQGLK